jgi:hypothetical protein
MAMKVANEEDKAQIPPVKDTLIFSPSAQKPAD